MVNEIKQTQQFYVIVALTNYFISEFKTYHVLNIILYS